MSIYAKVRYYKLEAARKKYHKVSRQEFRKLALWKDNRNEMLLYALQIHGMCMERVKGGVVFKFISEEERLAYNTYLKERRNG